MLSPKQIVKHGYEHAASAKRCNCCTSPKGRMFSKYDPFTKKFFFYCQKCVSDQIQILGPHVRVGERNKIMPRTITPTDIEQAKLKRPWGGHMINPPKRCKHKFIDQDIKWVDLAACAQTCKRKCHRRNRYSEMSKEEKRQELKNNGVRTI